MASMPEEVLLAWGTNLTVTVQLAPAGTEFPQLLDWRKTPPAETVMAILWSGAAAGDGFETVNCSVAPRSPARTWPKFSDRGDTKTSVPMPLKPIADVAPPPRLSVRAPLRRPGADG